MAAPTEPAPVLLILGTLHVDAEAHAEALARCVAKFGPIADRIGPFVWEHSRYYEPEMGPGIVRWFYRFVRPVSPAELVEIKWFTNGVEDALTRDGRRTVNLDPGLISRGNMVLATAKPRHQRVYIGKGIYGDLTMTYHSGAFQPLPWTYKDWGSDEARAFLGKGRRVLKALLKSMDTESEELL